MNRLGCFFSGGHKYSDLKLRVITDESHDKVTFTNICIKCGKSYKVELPYSVVLSTYLKDIYWDARKNEALHDYPKQILSRPPYLD